MTIFFWATAFLAALLGTIASFGISSILLPVAVNTFRYKTALALVSIFHLFGNLGRISFTKEIDKSLILSFGVPAVLFTVIGGTFTLLIETTSVKVLLGLILLIYAGLNLLDIELRVKPSTGKSLIGGVIYGFLSGLVGTGGPLRGAILMGFGLTQEKYIATSGAISLMIDLTRVPVYLWRGYLLPEYFVYVPLLLVVAVAGALLSKRLVEVINADVFSKVVQVAILIMGLQILYNELF